MREGQLTIGELADRTGVATSALRYWEEIGLLAAPTRVAGQRRYPPSAVELVGVILLLQEVGFTLRDMKTCLASPASGRENWRELYRRKLAELDQRIAHAQVARTAIAHALACPHEHVVECSTFTDIVAARLAGAPLDEAHPH